MNTNIGILMYQFYEDFWHKEKTKKEIKTQVKKLFHEHFEWGNQSLGVAKFRLCLNRITEDLLCFSVVLYTEEQNKRIAGYTVYVTATWSGFPEVKTYQNEQPNLHTMTCEEYEEKLSGFRMDFAQFLITEIAC